MVLKSLEGYFCNLAASTTNKKTVLDKLVTSNAKLASTNEELVAVVKKLINNNKDIQRESNRLKKRGGRGETKENSDPTMCPHCKKEAYHEPDAFFSLEKNKDRRPPGWKSGL